MVRISFIGNALVKSIRYSLYIYSFVNISRFAVYSIIARLSYRRIIIIFHWTNCACAQVISIHLECNYGFWEINYSFSSSCCLLFLRVTTGRRCASYRKLTYFHHHLHIITLPGQRRQIRTPVKAEGSYLSALKQPTSGCGRKKISFESYI